MKFKWKIIVSAPYMQPVIERFRPRLEGAGCEIVLPPVNERLSEMELLGIIEDIDGVICGDDRFTRRVLEKAKKLKVISKWGTGIDSIDREAASLLGIRVCNTPNAVSIPVADTVFAAMLAFARKTFESDQVMKAGRWEKIPSFSLAEKTLGVIGVGNVGKAVVKRAVAFGMTILGHDVAPIADDFVRETGLKVVDKDTLLEASDFVTMHTDLNPTSYHLMSWDDFRKMKDTAYFINTSRGPVVDESALIRALQDQQIAGAALDVFEVEPLPADSPLLKMSNVLLSAHNSNSSPAAWERVHENTIKNLLEGLEQVRPLRRAS
jgi:D-3-phosphoglycerate dehydrogenase